MAITVAPYAGALKHLLSGVSWETDTVKLALLGSGYTFDVAHAVFADVSASEIAGTNYSPGGQALSGKAATPDGAGGVTLTADNVVFAALTASDMGHAVLYIAGTVGVLTDPLLAHIGFGTNPVDVSAEDFPVNWRSAVFVIAAS
ncbi:GP27 protein [Solidesulfovibrio fructosivorans JJ]]|uniref:GP27 protein n=1 Tax=Solidesulfovibrio fructosivorans JJ] TaxID=596151 RepID=E1JRB3_SOLFR|nr:hypothetical protein [Solidesulfovibrio fructosivorans]EFL53114.1 GP27 protein [Solidesulfovibrio fructosivorans JJ]]